MDPHLNQGRRQVLGDGGQQIFREVELLQVLERSKGSGVDFRNVVVPQGQTLKSRTKEQ